jgi:arsenite methyltransferase
VTLRERATAELARQLGHPRGLPGRLVARILNRRNAAAVRAAVSAVPVRPGAVLADLGFGGGLGLELLLDRLDQEGGGAGLVHGVDVSETMITAATRHFSGPIADGRLRLHQAPIEKLPFAGGAVDAAITLNTIYFVPDLPAAFSELRRVLSPAGQLALGLGDPAAMARMSVTRQGFRLRPVIEVIDALSLAGFVVLQHRRVGKGDGAFHLLIAGPAPNGH